MSTRTRSENYISPPATVTLESQVTSVGGSCTTPPVNGAPTYSSGVYTPLSISRAMTDVVTPNFKKIVSSGGIVNSPMTSSRTVITQSPLDYHHFFAIEQYTCTPKRWISFAANRRDGQRTFAAVGINLPAQLAFTDDEKSSNNEIAITQAYANIDLSELNALVFIAEFPKSIKGLTSTFRNVSRVIRRVRKNELRLFKGLKPLKSEKLNLADLYMEARYNLRPMYYDTLGILKALRQKSTFGDRQTFRSKRAITKTSESLLEIEVYRYSTYMQIYLLGKLTSTADFQTRAGVLCKLDELAGQAWGFDRIADAIWDLTPFSFIVDWFINVGDTISSWAPVMGTKVLASWIVGTTTTIQSVQVEGSRIARAPSGTLRTNGETASFFGSYSKAVTTTERLPNFQRPVLPNVNVKLNPLKLLDLAVITGLIKSGREVNSFRI